ncbi:PREDICTED: activating transcription factor 3 [Nicrophorus vespilloides]|uniref:Activating transcription factor 3 n=1 Tax=Nicrophorus vespilloides TaxID=110193 RepID=A0ABM1M736_NICVS|nr:PREDICTED: activating transcription factor 3 [Nicrophorus vespilloides]XP_017770386.1 PREDICTED: activating transcription factor 3 [Nicrophorus vespilloides]
MYNLNINMATSAGNPVNNLLAVENNCTTPRTPEILNSLIAMTTNPLDNYNFGDVAPKKFHPNNMSSDSNSSSCSQESRTPTNVFSSVQQTCSQLIKAGLKLSIEQKRKLQSDSEDLLDLDKVKRIKKNESESEEDKYQNPNGLTAEDEERRRRRRERNKIAATKCRMKKRERTANLVTESETLESQNIELKSQIQELKKESAKLADMLNLHKTNCQKNIRPSQNRLLDANHSYSLPSSTDNNYRIPATTADSYNRPSSIGNYHFSKNTIQYPNKIIVESVNDDATYQTNLTNLDDPSDSYVYDQQCHNYSSSQQGYGNHGIDGCMA